MKKYLVNREQKLKKAKIVGIILTIGLHIAVCTLFAFTGFKYLYPPPAETSLLIDFSEEIPVKIKQKHSSRQPRAEVVNKKKKINLVQASEAQHKGEKPNEMKESIVDDFGDVDIKEPERKKEEIIDNRALFNAPKNKTEKDTLAAQTASKISDALKTGHPQGNTTIGKTNGKPNAHLKGRKSKGSLPIPIYNVQDEGTVVVEIWVDQYGKVQKAVPGAKGTTTSNKSLFNEARKAAMKAHFTTDGNAPALQKGTITYYFKLK